MKHLLQNVAAFMVLLLAACDAAEPAPGMPRVVRAASSYTAVATRVLDAGSYTYVEVKDDAGAQHWVVGLRKEVRPGAALSIRVFGTRDAFCSARLNRCFDHLEFGTLGVLEGT